MKKESIKTVWSIRYSEDFPNNSKVLSLHLDSDNARKALYQLKKYYESEHKNTVKGVFFLREEVVYE